MSGADMSTPATDMSGCRAETPAVRMRVSSPCHAMYKTSTHEYHTLRQLRLLLTFMNYLAQVSHVLHIPTIPSNAQHAVFESTLFGEPLAFLHHLV